MCCRNPDNVHCFGTIFPNLKFVFASNLCRPSGPHGIWWIEKLLNCQTDVVGATQLIPMGSAVALEFAKWHEIYTPEECANEWRQNNTDFKLLRHEWFQHVWHHVHDGGHCTGEFTTVIWRLESFTVSFRADICGESGLRELTSINRRTPQWARGRFTKTIMPAQFEKWRYIKFWYMC